MITGHPVEWELTLLTVKGVFEEADKINLYIFQGKFANFNIS